MAPKSALMTKILVYQNGIQVGYGYLIMGANGRMYKPTLINMNGEEELPTGMYDLQMTDEQHLIIMNRTIQ